MKKNLFIVLLFCISSSLYTNTNSLDSLFKELDKSISKRSIYFEMKENKLLDMRIKLKNTPDLKVKYEIANQLMQEYSYYKSDSALYYSNVCLKLAEKLDNPDYALNIRLNQAYLLSFACLFHESYKILESIDADILSINQQQSYYYTFILVLHNQIVDQVNSSYAETYRKRLLSYIDKYLSIAENNSYQYLSILAYQCYIKKNYRDAANLVKEMLNMPNLTPFQRSEALFNLSGVYVEAEWFDEEFTKKLIIEASIYNIRHAITKNPPLIYLAVVLMREDYNVDRAYNYINVVVEDAQRFSNQHKSRLVERTFNSIQGLLVEKIDKQRHNMQQYLTAVIFLCLVIFIGTCVLYFNNSALKKTRRQLSEANCKLRDSNRIKESYISHFLNECSSQIEKLDNFKNHIIRQLNVNQSREIVKKEALSSINVKNDLENLFLAFDRSILELYPDFVEKINELLKDDRKFEIRTNENSCNYKLSTELRILALIRLGINENKQIASFFRFTVQTVYNYRSKSKLRAINEDTFEEDILKIGAY